MFSTLTNLHGKAVIEQWPLERPFKIARRTALTVSLVVVELSNGPHKGRGECSPLARYNESPESVLAQVMDILSALEKGQPWSSLHDAFPAGAARNAVDCALWDLLAKSTGKSVPALLGLPPLKPVETVFTISLDTPTVMAAQALNARDHRILKVKLGSASGDMARLDAIRTALPTMRLIIDANEGWSREQLRDYLPHMAHLGIEMVEQPIPEGQDHVLNDIDRLIPLGADESCHTSKDIKKLTGLYDVLNIKLDKTGGLTEALNLLAKAQQSGFDCMIGCMLGTSLAMNPAMIIAQNCQFVDLDAPLLLGNDHADGLRYQHGTVSPSLTPLWG